MKNALTIDVEDWFQVEIFKNIIKYEDWDKCESRIIPNIARTLKLLAEMKVKATFFVLGWIAERYPEIVKAIDELGHEVSSHGYAHKPIYEQNQEEFSMDVQKSINILQSITKKKVLGYRAPSYSVINGTFWAWDVLASMNIKYDSSLFPVKHIRYGVPSAPRFPFTVNLNGKYELIEFPLSTVQIFGRNVPIAGGAYLRLYPYWFIKMGIKTINSAGKPVIMYFHPWELDSCQPKEKVGLMSRLRHYGNLALTERKVKALLKDFEFVTVREVLAIKRNE